MIRLVEAVCERCFYNHAVLIIANGVVVGNPICPFCHGEDYHTATDKFWEEERGRRSENQDTD